MKEAFTPEVIIPLAILTSFLLSYFSFPYLIRFGHQRAFLDYPGLRKVHQDAVPTLGGIGIFFGVFISGFTFLPYTPPVIIAFLATVFLFACGVYDDLRGINAPRKFLLQVAAAALVVSFGIRIESFHGLFGIYELALPVQYVFTIFVVVGITNAVNLIDGLDGLAGGIALINSLLLGAFLFLFEDYYFSLLSFSLAASLCAFLFFNFNPAKIFMGDTGSLPVGFLLAILGIRYLQIDSQAAIPVLGLNPLMIVMGLFLVPVTDTLRVMAERMVQKRSPFSADQNHIHHKIMQMGFSHRNTVLILYGFHLTIITVAYFENLYFKEQGELTAHSLILTVSVVVLLQFFQRPKARKQAASS